MTADPQHLLETHQALAVVGFSTDPMKEAHGVPLALLRRGFSVTPVHPTADEIAGLAIDRG